MEIGRIDKALTRLQIFNFDPRFMNNGELLFYKGIFEFILLDNENDILLFVSNFAKDANKLTSINANLALIDAWKFLDGSPNIRLEIANLENINIITTSRTWSSSELLEIQSAITKSISKEKLITQLKNSVEDINLTNVRLDKPVGEEGSNTLGDLILRADFVDPFEEQTVEQQVASVLSKLNDHDRKVIETFYGIDRGESRSAKETADELGMEISKVNQTLRLARHKLRKAFN